MKLITEGNFPNFNGIKDVIIKEDSTTGRHETRIEGIFIQAEIQNRNGRIYDQKKMIEAVDRYMQDRMRDGTKFRSYGELGHPEGVEINLHRVSHYIESLSWQGTNVIGVAKVIDTEYGRIADTILREGLQLGVSSRGLGELAQTPDGQNRVTEFELIAVDIVADPSAPDGFVEGILEGKDYIIEGGKYTEVSQARSIHAFNMLEKELKTLPIKEKDEYLRNSVKNFFRNL